MDNKNESESQLKQFQLLFETQSQIDILNSQVIKINKHITTKKIKIKRCEAALLSLSETSDDANVYKQVSRLLIKRDKNELSKELIEDKNTNSDDLPKLESVKSQLIAKLGGLNSQYIEINNQIRNKQYK